MTTDTLITVEQLSKHYSIRRKEKDRYMTLREVITQSPGLLLKQITKVSKDTVQEHFQALSEVSFEVQRGEVLGIIGRNGAGKSTLLKILSRITPPSSGRITLHGKVASLLEVGTGFHAELTGRENIFLSGAILGMKRREIRKKFDEIVAFAGVEKFIDTPVKRYSSGMYVRLGFAVAAHLEPDILLVDEVLAVGDAAFQQKCLGKIGKVAGEGRAVLFVSHNLGAVANLCDSTVLLEEGRIAATGQPQQVIQSYLATVKEKGGNAIINARRKGNGKIRLGKIKVFADQDDEESTVHEGGQLCIKLEYAGLEKHPMDSVRVNLRIDSVMGLRIGWLSTDLKPLLEGPRNALTFSLSNCPLKRGLYSITVNALVDGEQSDWIVDVCSFEVLEGDYYQNGKKVPDQQGAFFLDFEIQ